ncbi:N-acetylmuramic acid 6-phosphate phosphatase [Zhongshania aliphaticivorans]|uniref:N-acetylmuramic acid 6-phosphate phosphatase n=1 Tax=Zhongshania aliphaticivorans TaxID=1470434 RepID=A0A5S9MQ83_9GAMM|nr:HAD-IA family hydrolase [Zhongshania aliphaticivorans]CAA0078241.1 N-acetylmuramic acid 6-phosphate phosphatase [Zhongshania aliphaticivorans]CAA0086794.1 N-acetylmuramic acid 6-phosphate phosphatase [Zhongshania aliphaticivorans]
MLQAVLFDLDGTLLDTAVDFTTVLNHMLSERGQALQDYAAVRQRVSDGARTVVQLGFHQQDDLAGLLDEFLDRYLKQVSVSTTLFPGMTDVLNHIEERGLRWGIVTNKPLRFTTPLLAAMQLTERCSTVICPDHVTHKKPHPEPIYLACKEIDCLPVNTIYIGDHQRDIDAGRNANMRTVACRYGYISAADNLDSWGANYIVDTATDLIPLITQLHQS